MQSALVVLVLLASFDCLRQLASAELVLLLEALLADYAAGVAGTGGAVGGLVGNAVKDFCGCCTKVLREFLLIHVSRDLMGKRSGRSLGISMASQRMSAKRLGMLQRNLTYW